MAERGMYAIRVRVAMGLVAVMIAAVLIGHAPLWLIAVYVAMGALSAVLYALDKSAARRGAWRTAESTLHGVDLLCGIIGGLLAQEGFRHKTAKPGFASASWTIAGLHGISLTALTVVGWDWPIGMLGALAG